MIDVRIDPIIDLIVKYAIIPTSLNLTYTVIEGFDEPNGKFPNTLGNVALVDCHSIGNKIK